MGAFGAHELKSVLASHGTHDIWETAVFYHLVHAVALLGVGIQDRQAVRQASLPLSRWLVWATRCWSLGVMLFSGSLYALALGGPPRLLGPVTALGGLALLAGWGCVIAEALTVTRPTDKS